MIPLCSMPCIKYNLYAYYIQCTGIITLFDTCIHGIHTIHIYIYYIHIIYYEQDPKKVQRKYSSNVGNWEIPSAFLGAFLRVWSVNPVDRRKRCGPLRTKWSASFAPLFMTNGPCPEKRAQKCAVFLVCHYFERSKKNVFRTKHKYKCPLLEEGSKGKIKIFRKKSLYKIASNTPY